MLQERRTGSIQLCVLAGLSIAAPLARARVTQQKLAPIERSCGEGVIVRLSAAQASQGSLLLLEVRSKKALSELTGEWNGRSVAFWEVKRAQKSRKNGAAELREGLLGVDLERTPGKEELVIGAQTADEKQASCKIPVVVTKGRFATESLQVAPQFVEPNPEQIERAKTELRRLREIFDHVTPEPLWKGGFRVPLDGVQRGKNFGRRRILNGEPRSPHTGVDFPAAKGTPVHVAQAGRVALAQELYFSGNTVVLDHGLGIYTLYGHLDSIAVREGEVVKPGELLGLVGATGRVTGPHLHWGLTVERARVNPLEIVKVLGRGMR